jgi:hypothetical protein
MFTLRCTKNLLGRFGAASRAGPSAASDAAPTTRLGDWHANVLYRTGAELVLLVNDRSLLPVVVSARPGELIVARFLEALGAELLRLGVPADVASAEIARMADVQLGPTRSRQILGTMNDFDRMLDSYLTPGNSLVEVALRLAEAPCGPIAMRRPADVAVELLASGE